MTEEHITPRKLQIEVKLPPELSDQANVLMPCLISAAGQALQTFFAVFLECISKPPASGYNPGDRKRC